MKSVMRKALHYVLPHYYRVGAVKDFLPPQRSTVGGTSMDFYALQGVPFAYTMELPDLGQFGFQLPPEHILPVIMFCMRGFVDNLQPLSLKNVDEII